jgi:hypothetical protein
MNDEYFAQISASYRAFKTAPRKLVTDENGVQWVEIYCKDQVVRQTPQTHCHFVGPYRMGVEL